MADPAVEVPAQFGGRTLSTLAASAASYAKTSEGATTWPPVLVFDFAKLKFIRPAGAVFLSNLAYWLNEKGTHVKFRNCDLNRPPIKYLDDSLFFEQHCGAKLSSFSTPRTTTRPLMRISQSKSHDWLETNFVPWLAARLSITAQSLHPTKVCISELFNNIQDHTRYDIGSLFIQHFPAENSVIISVSDFGLGIPEKVREKVPDLSDDAAIKKAVEEGFTTKSKPTNAGMGLDYLLKTVVLQNGGEVTIYSGRSIVRFVRKQNAIKPIATENVGFCPGTTIDIVVRTDTIEVVPDEMEELKW